MANREFNYNEKSRANLKPLKKGDPGRNPNGRPKKLKTVLKSLPEDIQEQVYKVLGFCLTLPDETAATKYLECKQGELGEYGFVLQIAIKQLTSKGWGWGAVCDILERLFGKPTIKASVDAKGEGVTIIVQSAEQKEAIETLGDLGI